MVPVPADDEGKGAQAVDAALCVDSDSLDRFGGVLRHLAVGLVDQAVPLRLISPDARIDALTLGPVQAIVHPALRWPYRVRHLSGIKGALTSRPPSVFHATACGSYSIATDLAELMDADLVWQVTSMDDCDAIANLDSRRVGRFIAFSEPLGVVLKGQLSVDPERISLIRPGMRARGQIACFSVPGRAVTLLCLSRFKRGRGVENLIKSVDILQKRGHDVMLFLMGHGRQESKLRRLVRERGLFSCVTFADPSGEPSPAMQSADVFVRPSDDNAFLEDTLQAMGTGMAVVACASPVCDHLRDGETSVLCDGASAQSIAGAVERLLLDRDWARTIASTGVAYVKDHHAMSGMAERIAALYRELALARATFSIKR